MAIESTTRYLWFADKIHQALFV